MQKISNWVWHNKYRYGDEKSTEDTMRRVAKAVAAVEKDKEQKHYERQFSEMLVNYKFLPGGRILANAGTNRQTTLSNCYVMPTIPDSLDGICDVLHKSAMTLKAGGGVGMDFSTLRPRGAAVVGVDGVSSGAVSFMGLWDSMCATIMSAGARRGAMMACLRSDHPDVEEFISAKHTAGKLTNFNMSVTVTDSFMKAVDENASWDLVFGGKVYKTVQARDLWDKIMKSTYEFSEPGVIFIDRMNERNALKGVETIAATNPCGEQPLPPNGACTLGSLNLTKFVVDPFCGTPDFDMIEFERVARLAVRFLDNVVEISNYPLAEQKLEAMNKRRIGIGITGLADTFAMLGMEYASKESCEFIDTLMQALNHVTRAESQSLALQKGAFPLLPMDDLKRRNSHLLSIAPTGTISLFAGNVSSGIEPMFSLTGARNVLMPDGTREKMRVDGYAYHIAPQAYKDKPELWVTADKLSLEAHTKIVAICQKYVDSSISKTINLPTEISFDSFKDVYRNAYALGLKGATTYRPNDIRGSVLIADTPTPATPTQAPASQTVATAPTQPITLTTASNVVPFTSALERDEALVGTTYKIKPNGAAFALYVTINDIEHNGRRRPFEVFFNSKEVDGYAWRVALSRMISAVFRKGGDVAFVADELKSVFDPRGGHWQNGKFIPSTCASIGAVIEKHMKTIGFIQSDEVSEALSVVTGKHCPKCQSGRLLKREGCEGCDSCDYSRC